MTDQQDKQFNTAVRLVIEQGYCRTSALQRRMTIGYSTAARLVDRMAKEGVIGEYQPDSLRRNVEITLAEWEAKK